MAPEAIIHLLGSAHREGSCLLIVKGTQTYIIAAGPLEVHITADHINDIVAGPDLLDQFVRISHVLCVPPTSLITSNLAREICLLLTACSGGSKSQIPHPLNHEWIAAGLCAPMRASVSLHLRSI